MSRHLHHPNLPSVLLLPILAGPVAAQIADTVKSTFETDLEGWTAINYVAFQQEASGGNPGGRLFVDNDEGQVCTIFAPSKFLGDKSAYVGGTLSFDGNLVGTGGSPWMSTLDYGHVRLSGGGLMVEIDFVPGQPSMSWETHQEALTGSNWGMSDANFKTLMSSLTEIRISVEALFGPEQEAIDNVILHASLPDAECVPYDGTGINPHDFTCLTPPVVGQAWLSSILTPPGTTQTLIALSPGYFVPPYPNPLGAGELFINLTPTPIFSVSVGVHTALIPPQPTLLGAPVAAQGGRLFGAAGFQPLNGIQLKLGV